MKKDYYLILRLTPKATADEIRSAYHRRALEVHPDVSGGDSAPFRELQEAYAVLSDPAQRAVYDGGADEIPIRRGPAGPGRSGDVILRRQQAEPLTEPRSAAGFEDISLFRSFETCSPSLEETFERLWSNFTRLTRPKAERMEGLQVEVPLSARQAFEGGAVRLLVPARMICRVCGGRGNVGPCECLHCEGHGVLTGEYPLTVNYPAGLQGDYIARIPLDRLGIHNLHLIVRFRPAETGW
ncbi:MAG: J domain-containing protein [Verrucomicrobia bacterium]|nr:J domain-containing protein [Verrucomicrobiota bacterium]